MIIGGAGASSNRNSPQNDRHKFYLVYLCVNRYYIALMADSDSIPTHPIAQGLTISNVSFAYPARRKQPKRQALDNINLQILPGQRVALLGPNGCGKSTLMKNICGLLRPDKGTIEVFSKTKLVDIRSIISVVFQAPGLDRHLSVYENLRDQASLYGITKSDAQERIKHQLEQGNLTDRKSDFVKTLSTGLTRRVDLARAMLNDPYLLILDEPTVGLDPIAREGFLKLIEKQQEENPKRIVLLSTHLVDEADRCDRVLLMHKGRIIADGQPGVLRETLGQRRVTVFTHNKQDQPNIADLNWEKSSTGWSAPLDIDEQQVEKVVSQLTRLGCSFSVAPPTLADVFEHSTGSQLDLDDQVDIEESAI